MDKKSTNLKFIFDLDGTLLTSDKVLTTETIKQIHLLQAQNHLVFIATGRPYYMNKEIIELLNIQTPIISANGAAIYDPKTEKIIYSNTFSQKDAEQITLILEKYQIDFLAYALDQMLGENIHNPLWFEKMIYPKVKDPSYKYSWKYTETQVSKETQNLKFIKFLILAQKIEPSILEKALAEIEKVSSNIYFVKSQSSVIDIMPKGSNKWNSVQKAFAYMNLDISNSYAFGDALNDFEMIKNASCGIAMGNAVAEVKKVAKIIIDTNDNEGVARFLARNGYED